MPKALALPSKTQTAAATSTSASAPVHSTASVRDALHWKCLLSKLAFASKCKHALNDIFGRSSAEVKWNRLTSRWAAETTYTFAARALVWGPTTRDDAFPATSRASTPRRINSTRQFQVKARICAWARYQAGSRQREQQQVQSQRAQRQAFPEFRAMTSSKQLATLSSLLADASTETPVPVPPTTALRGPPLC